MLQRTLAMIKPDAFRNKVVGKILSRIEDEGFTISAMKFIRMDLKTASGFYKVHQGKPFYEKLVHFMSSGPSLVLILECENAIDKWRSVMGPTDPEDAPEGTLRKLYGTNVRENTTHGSDASETAAKEISFFFATKELLP